MAMLVLPEVFERTWGRKAQSFWPEATKAVREQVPGFCFMAEVYWDMEWALQQQGFDYAYDKRLYDRLIEGHTKAIREHFYAGLDYQDKLARFLENHDEPRAAATFKNSQQRAAALITFLSPGLRFFHQGQFEGRKKRISPHLVRAPQEPIDEEIKSFYPQLLSLLKNSIFRDGNWQLLESVPAWEGNGTWDSFIVFAWTGNSGEHMLIAVNYSPHDGQCYARLPFPELAGKNWRLQDLLSEACFDRNGNDIYSRGLYLDMLPWQYHVLEIKNLTI
jgi:glycosidase